MPRSQLPGTNGPGGPTGPVTPPPRRGPSKIAVAAAVLALVSGAWLMHLGTETHAPPAPSPSDALLGSGRHDGAPGGSPAPGAAAVTVAPLPPSVPVRVRIPAIRVDAPMMKLGVDSKNEIQVPPPTNTNMAGWYQYGAAPGASGASVLLGHVDTLKGPAVFYNLGSLHKGNTIQVTRTDHRVAVFTVYGIEVYSKADFPTDRVYDDTPTPELRVITCGGGFSKSTHSYLGNVVVYARLTAAKTEPKTAPRPPAASARPSSPVKPLSPLKPSSPVRPSGPVKAPVTAPATASASARATVKAG